MNRTHSFPLLVAVLLGSLYQADLTTAAVLPEATDDVIELTEGLAIDPVGRYGRAPFHVDLIAHQFATGEIAVPVEGGEVDRRNERSRTWRRIVANEEGWFRDRALRGGYLSVVVHSEMGGPALLDARGHSMVYVNGEPRGGDLYNLGLTLLPVELQPGENWLLFHVSRGQVRAKLRKADDLMFDHRDAIWPTPVAGETEPVWGALLLVHPAGPMLNDLVIIAIAPNGAREETDVAPMSANTVRKVPVRLPAVANAPAGEKLTYTLRLIDRHQPSEVRAETTVDLTVASPFGNHTRTFISEIDGSVQYYAVRPPPGPGAEDGPRPGLILALHGAGVEGAGMRNQYSPKEWAYVVAPTNRRAFGFDWEDWGRLDAMEVLAHAKARYDTDPQRTWLTGHSMGGHGTWQIGAHFPDQFAAIGPSAGWVSFWSYTGAETFDVNDPVEAILDRAVSASNTLALKENYAQQGVYILHGDADDNVPVDQARLMVRDLATFHGDFAYREMPGAGHWWGSQCCDWPAMMEFFNARTIPASQDVRQVRFTTASPGVSASCHWVSIHQQQHSHVRSGIMLQHDRDAKQVSGSTENIRTLQIDTTKLRGELTAITLDEQTIAITGERDDAITLQRVDDTWQLAESPSPAEKSPERSGPFKSVFNNRVLLVYGTIGTPDENDWSFARARFDAETFGYRGNGSFEMIPDTAFDPQVSADRNVVLYGNADTNGAWKSLLSDSPIQVDRMAIAVGERRYEGNDLATLFIRPRADSSTALVGVVGGTGLTGCRTTDRMPIFVSGVAYPDWIVFDVSTLIERTGGVRAAGFFGHDWTIDPAQSAFRN